MFLSKIDYDSLTAPFLYRLGDTLASYIEYNTDTFNNLKPIEYDEDSEEEEVVDEAGEDQEDVAAAIQASLGSANPTDTIEEEKEEKPQEDDEQQISTVGAAIKAPVETENGEGAAND